ncbi:MULTISPECIES: LpqN/LpqT family lipoprotein [Nocardiaceae]|uniref:LpqN/LpqT family lipoprotein n=1 Tax=Rhodococcoides yunnanense TaxID=278209 RepID=A0ABU4BE71_9NOCA|nr:MULTISPECIES: LpqN/LpqT family lipoprotein [Rhodococcus]MDI9897963.1 LpqN/LpqT family lipoprotein [Rhodococcus sp. IEGM 1381]MDV6262497.1 LpqN/LpqT family lipoprotein [Rhodococcus yunnanensis]
MTLSTTGVRGAACAAVVILGLTAAGCSSSSDTATATTSAAATTTTEAAATTTVKKLAPATTTEAPAGPNPTIADYIVDAGLTEIPVTRDDPTAPTINLAIPDGWVDAAEQTPEWAYGAIIYPEVAADERTPSMIAIVSKLEGDVDPQAIIDYAPGELMNLPQFTPSGEGAVSTLSGFPAYQIAGTYVDDTGAEVVSAQKTAIITGQDGYYILQINVDGSVDQFDLLVDATTQVDDQTTITP